MSTMQRTTRRRSQLVGDERKIAGVFTSRKYGYGDAASAIPTGSRFAMRVAFPEMNGYGEVTREQMRPRMRRTDQLLEQKEKQRGMVVEKWSSKGMRASIAAMLLAGIALLFLALWLSNISGLIALNRSNADIASTISTVENRIVQLNEDIILARADVDVAYQATGLGMIPASSTAVVGLNVPADAIIGPNGLAHSETVSILLGE